MKEHIVHFKIIRNKETKQLRGLILLESNTEPTLHDYEQCLINCGHQVQVDNAEQLIFKASDTEGAYSIHILKNYGQNTRDHETENLAKSFMKSNPLI